MEIVQHRAVITSLEYVSPGCPPFKIALLLLDADRDRLHMRFRTAWTDLDDSALELVSALSEDLTIKAQELGATALMDYLQNMLSNVFRVTETEAISIADFEIELDRRAQELLLGIEFPSMEDSAARSSLSFFRTAPRSLEIAKRKIARGVAFSKRADVGYAVASGACVLALLCTGVTLMHPKKLTESRQTAIVQAPVPERSHLDGAENFVTSSLFVTPTVGTSAVSEPRKAKARRARYSRRTDRRTPTQIFTPPSVLMSSPQVVAMLANEAPIQTPTELIPPQFEDLPRAITPPPLERIGGVRRFLQALVYPFKKVGQGLAN